MYEVEKNIPVPPSRISRENKYPFGRMAVGDSLMLPIREQNAVASTISVNKKRHPEYGRFSVRRVDADTLRCWRIE